MNCHLVPRYFISCCTISWRRGGWHTQCNARKKLITTTTTTIHESEYIWVLTSKTKKLYTELNKRNWERTRCNHTYRQINIHSSYSTHSLVQTLTYNRCHLAFFFFFLKPFFFLSSSWTSYQKAWKCMNDKRLTKKFHITLLALLLIQVFVFLSFCLILICLYFFF